MGRTFVLLAIGAAVGAAATYLATPHRSAPVTAPILTAEDGGTGRAGRVPGLGESPTIAELADVFRLAAEADAPTLRALAARFAALPESQARYVALEALLNRYAELDARAALETAQEIAPHLVVRLLQTLARTDPDAALAALRGFDDPNLARSAAMAVLRGLGDDPDAIERVLAAMPAGDRSQFRRDAIGIVAEQSPVTALREALAIADRTQRLLSAQQVISRWATSDPRAALAAVETVPDAMLRNDLLRMALNGWASSEPQSVLDYLATTNLARNVRDPIEQMAANSLASRDPHAALAYFARLPAGPQRQQLAQIIAHGYGARDPEGALVWARGLQPPQPEAVAAILGALARTDPARAFDRVRALPRAEQAQALRSVVMSAASMGDDSATAALAERVLAFDDAGGRQLALQTLLSRWSSTSPDAATEWLLANLGRADVASLRQIGQQFGQVDPERASGYVARIPPDARDTWVTAIAQGYARSDPQQALAWIRQYRGQPSYGTAAATVAQVLAQYDLQAAVGMLADIDPRTPAGQQAAMSIAQQWALHDPRAATDWALANPDRTVRPLLLAATTQAWAIADPQGARAWALGQPPGASRDAALQSLVPMLAQAGALDQSVLSAFSAPLIRERAVVSALLPVAMRDGAEARRLMDANLTDPNLRAQAEQMLAAAEQGVLARPPTGSIGAQGIRLQSGALFAPPLGTVMSPSGVVLTSPGMPVQVPVSPSPTRPAQSRE